MFKCVVFVARTYINLQDAYVVEANALGSWSQVGYTGAGTSSANGSATGIFWYKEGADGKAQWQAQALQKLNDCAKGDKWGIVADISGSESDGQSNAVYNTGASETVTGGCIDLTPSFSKLTSGRSTATAVSF